MKDKLQEALGSLGLILTFLLSAALTVIPVVAADLPFWLALLVFALISFTKVIGAILTVGLWAYATYVVVTSPLSLFSIIFFLALICYLIFYFIPAVINLLSMRK